MEKLWKIIIIALLWSNFLQAQRSVALLRAPARPLYEEIVVADKLVSMPFELVRGMIYVKAELEGRPGEFILDTGAPGLVINEHPEAVSEDFSAQSCSQSVNVGSKSVERFSWARRTLRNIEAITLDLSHLDRFRPDPLTGMIGYELLKHRTLLLDYERRQLALLKEKIDVADHPPVARIPFILDQHLPIITVKVGAKTLRFGIDTGAASNLLDRESAQALNDLLTQLPVEELQGLDQSIQRVKAVALAQITGPAGFQFASKFLIVDLSHLSGEDGKALNGLLGYQFLSNYRVAIDYPNREMLLWEN